MDLFNVVAKGDVNTLRELLLSSGADVNTRNKWRESLLYIASERDEKDIVLLLLEYGANCELSDFIGGTPLHIAWSIKTTTLLLEAGANYNATTKDGYTPLYYAVCDNNKALVQLLLYFGAEKSIYTNTMSLAKGEVRDLLSRWPTVPPLVVLCLRVIRVKTNKINKTLVPPALLEWPKLEDVLLD